MSDPTPLGIPKDLSVFPCFLSFLNVLFLFLFFLSSCLCFPPFSLLPDLAPKRKRRNESRDQDPPSRPGWVFVPLVEKRSCNLAFHPVRLATSTSPDPISAERLLPDYYSAGQVLLSKIQSVFLFCGDKKFSSNLFLLSTLPRFFVFRICMYTVHVLSSIRIRGEFHVYV